MTTPTIPEYFRTRPGPLASTQSIRQLAAAIEATGAAVPAVVANALTGWDTLCDWIDAQEAADPVAELLDPMIAGTITAAKLDKAATSAAAASSKAAAIEPLLDAAPRVVAAFHQKLWSGGADDILDALRTAYVTAATNATAAQSLIGNRSAETILSAGADPEVVAAWQELPGYTARMRKVGPVLKFFTSDGHFPLWPVLEQQPGACGSTSFFTDGGGLRSVAEAREAVRVFAEAQWAQFNQPNQRGHYDEDGRFVSDVGPNPYRAI